MKQTAVEWLVEQMIYQMATRIENTTIGCELFEQAKEMEKQQIIEAAERWKGTDFAEKYYNETYGSKGSDDSPKVQNKDSFGEISDEEIEEMLFHHSNEYAYGFKDAIQWYREQLKQRQ